MDGSPLTLRGDEVIQPKFSIDLLQPQMDSIIVELCLGYAIGGDRSRQPRELSLGLTPTTTSLTRGIRINWINVRRNKGQENRG